MRIKIALICGVLGATVACGVGSARADSSLKIEKIDTEKGLENSLVKFVFYPDYGARVGEAWYKPANVNVAGQKFDSDGLPDGLGGLLTRDPVSFAFNVLRDTPEAVSIRFFRTDMLRERVVTLRRNQAMLQLDYVFANEGQEETDEYVFMVRNFPWPDGGPSDSGTASLCVPTTKAVRVMPPGKEHPQVFPEMGGKFMVNVGGPWLSTTGSKHGITMANVFAEDSLFGYYWWNYRSVAMGTHEWVFRKLPPGKVQNVTSYFILFEGMPAQVDITRDYAMSLEKTIEGDHLELKMTLLSLARDLGDVRVRTELAGFDGKLIATLPETALGDVPLHGQAEGTVRWEGDLSGNMLVRQRVFSAGKEIGRYEDALRPGDIPESYTRKIDLPKPRYSDIPGWKKEVQRGPRQAGRCEALPGRVRAGRRRMGQDAEAVRCGSRPGRVGILRRDVPAHRLRRGGLGHRFRPGREVQPLLDTGGQDMDTGGGAGRHIGCARGPDREMGPLAEAEEYVYGRRGNAGQRVADTGHARSPGRALHLAGRFLLRQQEGRLRAAGGRP